MILVSWVGLEPVPTLPLQDSVQPSETTLGHLDLGSFQTRQTDMRNMVPLLQLDTLSKLRLCPGPQHPNVQQGC